MKNVTINIPALFVFGIATLASTCSVASQPAAQSQVAALFNTFVAHPTHCAALLDGRAGVMLDAQSKSKKQDEKATVALDALLAAAGNDYVRSGLVNSLMRECDAKRK